MEAQTVTVAYLLADGSYECSQAWPLEDLSPKWVGILGDFIDAKGPAIDCSLGSTLDRFHIMSFWTGSAVSYRISVHDMPVVIGVLLSGDSADKDAEALAIFTSSAKAKGVADLQADAYAALDAIGERPLLVSMLIMHDALADQDLKAATELNIHLAGAYLRRIFDAGD